MCNMLPITHYTLLSGWCCRALLQQYYELIQLLVCHLRYLAVYRPDNRILLIFVGEQTGAPEFLYSQYDTMLLIRISGLITSTLRLRLQYLIPLSSPQSVTSTLVLGSVLRWWLTFP